MFVVCETFLNPGEPSSATYRVRPIPGQPFSTSMRVQCSRAMRHSVPLGTRLKLWVTLVEPAYNEPFLRHNNSDPWEILP